MMRRGRPGLLGTVARTAVVAGTATATANAVNKRQANKQQAAYEEQQQQAAEQQQIQEQQAQINQLQQQVGGAQQAPSAPAPAAAGSSDLISQLQQLASLRDSGVLSNDEFEQAKAKLLAAS